jgi:hypothetical protein
MNILNESKLYASLVFAVLAAVSLSASLPYGIQGLWPSLNDSTIQQYLLQHPNGTITIERPPMEACNYSIPGIACSE